jgi:hypothetical protein
MNAEDVWKIYIFDVAMKKDWEECSDRKEYPRWCYASSIGIQAVAGHLSKPNVSKCEPRFLVIYAIATDEALTPESCHVQRKCRIYSLYRG